MSERIVYLKVPERVPTAVTPAVIVGKQYRLDNVVLPGELHGLCGGLDYTAQHGRVLPPSQERFYLWDVDDELSDAEFQLSSAATETIAITPATRFTTSRFVLSHGAISEPQIINQESTPQLTTTASFDFVFSTDMGSVQLGVLSLVESQRFAMLKNGERHTLRECGIDQPVLYLDDRIENCNEVITPILQSRAGVDAVQRSHHITLTQSIPECLADSPIDTLTVLEQYTSCFMQRELPFTQENIWTPVCAPITWGWSMRVTQRQDGDWCIVRQKLLMPTVGHNGLELPTWEGNQLGR